MMWTKEISEGPMWGPQPTRARLGVLARPGGLCPPGAPPLVLFASKILKNSEEKNHIWFSEHSENFYFWVIFLLHGKFRKQTKHGILFYLTNKDRKKVGREGSAY